MSEWILITLGCSNGIQEPVLNISPTWLVVSVEFWNIILSGLWKGCSNIVHAVLINDICFILAAFCSIVSNKHYFHVLWVWNSTSIVETVWVWIYFQLFHTSLTTNFWWLFVVEAWTHHLTADELVGALVWISQFIIDSNLIAAWVTCCILANISIWLRHSCHIWNTSNDITWISCFIATCKVVSMVLRSRCNHCRGSVLISNSMFGSLTLLILYEVIMSSGTMVSIWVVPSVMSLMRHLLR